VVGAKRNVGAKLLLDLPLTQIAAAKRQTEGAADARADVEPHR
jgi:hypothetical protein